MIKLKKFAIILSLLSLATLSHSAMADTKTDASADKTSTSNLLVYINPVFYEHPVRMLHPYLDYWHMRGPMFEKVAVETLNKAKLNGSQLHAQNCKADLTTNITVSLEPYIFYNPQLRVFHSEVIANVYAGKLVPIATYKATAQQQGELNNVPEYYLKRAYTKAMQGIVTKMQADASKFSNAPSLDNNVCLLLNNVPTTRKFF